MQTTKHTSTIWQWVALIAVLFNVFFSYYTNVNPINGQTNGDVSAKYPTLITPAGYAFSIWGVIYLSLIIYAIYQLLPAQRNKQIYNKLSVPLIATSILSICWLISFSYEILGLSVIIISAMLLTAILLFGWSKEAIFHKEFSRWIAIPFGLYLGWLSVATITNIAVWLTSIGWQGGTASETIWTIIMLGVVLIAGILISYIFKDIAYPLVISWATLAIYVARSGSNAIVASAALGVAVIILLWAIGFGIWIYKRNQPQKVWQAQP